MRDDQLIIVQPVISVAYHTTDYSVRDDDMIFLSSHDNC